jgi:hypothetical protein
MPKLNQLTLKHFQQLNALAMGLLHSPKLNQ